MVNRLVLSLALALPGFAFVIPTSAAAQVGVHIDLGLPASPPLVEVQPGVQIVEGVPDEVFFSGGYYWCHRGDGWYRARSPRSQFVWVDRHRVPESLARMPEGQYRNWRHEDHPEWHAVEHRGHGHVAHAHAMKHEGQHERPAAREEKGERHDEHK